MRAANSTSYWMAALAMCSAQCMAQTIEISQERYGPGPALPFARPEVAGSLPAPQASNPASAAPRFLLKQGQPLHTELQAWAKAEDWELRWYPPVSWRVFKDADLTQAGELTAAVGEVIEALRNEGKPLMLRVSEGNRVMEISLPKEGQE